MTVPKDKNMHTATQRKIAALRRAAGVTTRQIFLPCRITIPKMQGQFE